MVVLGSQRARGLQQEVGEHVLLQTHPGSHPSIQKGWRHGARTSPSFWVWGGFDFFPASLVTAHFELPRLPRMLTQAQNTSCSLGGTSTHLFFLLHLLLAPTCLCTGRMTILSHLAHSELSVSF